MNPKKIAQIAYEVNAAFCRAFGDDSFSDWHDAPDWQKQTNIDGVVFHLENPEADEGESHQSWYDAKLSQGWRWAAEKDPKNKLHPCMVPFLELPVEQRAKDFLFKQVVHSCFSQSDG